MIDKQLVFTTKIVENMKGRTREERRDAMIQFAEPTRKIVERAIVKLSISRSPELEKFYPEQ